jgi:hypothetical protein
METYGLVFITVAAPFLIFALGRPGVWATGGLVALFLLARVVSNALSYRRSLRDFERGRCVRCGYDTRASSGRCPECGDELIAHAATYWRSFLR